MPPNVAKSGSDVLPCKDTTEAAEFLNVSASWLEKDRLRTRPEVPFVRMGSRMVRYRPADLIAYAERNLVATAA